MTMYSRGRIDTGILVSKPSKGWDDDGSITTKPPKPKDKDEEFIKKGEFEV